MNLANSLAVILTLVVLFVSFKTMRKTVFNAKSLARIGVVAAMTIVLYMIKIIPFPQGGGCSLLSILPIMILSVVFGMEEGIICAIVVASTKIIIQPPYYLMQLPLDYFGAMISVAFTPMFGTLKKNRLVAGAGIAVLLSTFFSILSGVIFFGQYAPEGMNVWAYSIMYNFLGYGVEAFLSVVVLAILPLKVFRKINNKSRVEV
ncbi:energy-coupled thiamine transporter ThiT [Oceanirhabdus seepicola]|uniref:Energy-coupled thiamine transporter ThiT n=1 Tax=Oceanirhabdus seepicola TaxID=2828781 RepID=A0A9J6NYS5_9CLOT|nr:energy-coupled thiamine transporter ThiT [Oceanirhabdus seepicola]MCM1988773.1 energy-coupled thiamine transporter ThiT [Oceanirhabdus seepicola]